MFLLWVHSTMLDLLALSDSGASVRGEYSRAVLSEGPTPFPPEFANQRLQLSKGSFGATKNQFLERWPQWREDQHVRGALERTVIFRNAIGHSQVQPFRNYLPRLHDVHPDWSRVRTPSKDHWMSFGSARSDLYRYNPAFGMALRRTCRVELYVDSPTVTPSDVFDWLFERREEIEAEVPQEIDWDRLDGNRACRIAVYFRDEVRVTEEHRWPELIDWFVETLGQLKAAFDPVIRDYPRDAGT